MKKFKVLLTDRIDMTGIRILKKVAYIRYASSYAEDILIKEAVDVHGIIVRVPAVITRRIIENAANLKVIGRFGVGTDNIDVAAAAEKGIVVTFTPAANTLSVAEYTVTLMFALAKHVLQADAALRKHDWAMRLNYPGIELAGKTLGIVGMGEIGSEVARLAKLLGMQVIYCDIARRDEIEKRLKVEYVPFTRRDKAAGLNVPGKFLAESDFVSLHAALTSGTEGLIGKKEIALMKDGAFFINTARGKLVKEQELYLALKTGKLAGAGLDVFAEEPPYDSPLLSLQNTIVGPHVAALAKDALRRVSMWVAEDMVRVLKGKRPLHPVNPQVLDRQK